MLLVDAANVVGSRPDGWWRDRPGAADRLVARLRSAVAAGALASPVLVVVEGAARAGPGEGAKEGVQVVHAAGSGDDFLVEIACAAEERVTLVSADRELAARVRELGGDVVGPQWLLERMGQSSDGAGSSRRGQPR